MGGLVTLIYQFDVGADLAVIALYEFEEAENCPFIHRAENERRSRFERAFFNVFSKADEAIPNSLGATCLICQTLK
jgi:hypothetical protein